MEASAEGAASAFDPEEGEKRNVPFLLPVMV